ncbi:TIM barrel protein [Roseospira marina]|uniref:TIM barrel protein n=1 Tax=Roseospira marina TaxID=140057 RepID=A0A5M6I9C0_9PROT|nr:TIM barrel protein [Roseospira marina]KAA5604874.1 TIM barrel protein [Roseospira marina]MBB4315211.1 hydroxypyruvate isomerase [Roseospira marina]MBB5088211.1 hydroxypyruvate isomerase [Roseospira marina]
MPRFAAHLSMLFTEVAYPDRFSAAAQAGFKGVELGLPYHLPLEQLGDRISMAELAAVTLTAPPGDWGAGERGLAAVPGRESEFRDGLEIALETADFVECPAVVVMAGVVPEEDWGPALETFMDNLAYAAAAAAERDLRVLIGAVNPVDVPGAFLTRPEDALQVVEEIGNRHLGLLFDLYHAQMECGALTDTLEDAVAHLGHVRIAGVPGRNEPDALGEVNWRYLFDQLDAHGYGGWVGCAYHPRSETRTGLRWARDWGIGA